MTFQFGRAVWFQVVPESGLNIGMHCVAKQFSNLRRSIWHEVERERFVGVEYAEIKRQKFRDNRIKLYGQDAGGGVESANECETAWCGGNGID